MGRTHVSNGQSCEHGARGNNTLGGTSRVEVAPGDEEGLDCREEECDVVTAHETSRGASRDLCQANGAANGKDDDDAVGSADSRRNKGQRGTDTRTGHLSLILLVIHIDRSRAVIPIAPVGICMRMVVNVLNPNP